MVHQSYISGTILGMGSANERRCYIVTMPLIGWAHTKNDPYISSAQTHPLRYYTINEVKKYFYATVRTQNMGMQLVMSSI